MVHGNDAHEPQQLHLRREPGGIVGDETHGRVSKYGSVVSEVDDGLPEVEVPAGHGSSDLFLHHGDFERLRRS